LALPAIGVGYQKHPAATATEIMLQAVRDYIDEIRSPDVKPSLQQIDFLDMSDSVANHFHESAIKVFGKTCLHTPAVAPSVSAPRMYI
jgi:O-acetyl-ADP-ribose deacetylase (regulator of RNase III)